MKASIPSDSELLITRTVSLPADLIIQSSYNGRLDRIINVRKVQQRRPVLPFTPRSRVLVISPTDGKCGRVMRRQRNLSTIIFLETVSEDSNSMIHERRWLKGVSIPTVHDLQ